jgi:hypothetical protein
MADVIPATTLPYGGTWEGLVGVSGGIPTTQTRWGVGGTGGAQITTYAQLAAAISACPSSASSLYYLDLASGTFLVTADLAVNKSGLTLRGQVNANGAPTTIFSMTSGKGIQIQKTTWDFDAPAQFTNITISSGHTRGSSTVTLASTPTGLATGMLMVITAPISAPTIDGDDWSCWFGSTDNHPFSNVVKVTGVAGNQVSFTPPLNADYISGLTCKVHYRGANDQITLSGLENIVMTPASGWLPTTAISMQGADQCWVKNCKISGLGTGSTSNEYIAMIIGFRNEVRHCEMLGPMQTISSSAYCMVSPHCSGLLVIDNYFHYVPNVWPMYAVSGSAFAYNYMVDECYDSPLWLSQIVYYHGSHSHYNLFEGNWLPSMKHDWTNNPAMSGNYSHSRNTATLRNRLIGWDANATQGSPKEQSLHPLCAMNHNDNFAVAGNVLGYTGKQTQYEQLNDDYYPPFAMYAFGSVTKATCIRKHNYGIYTGNTGIPAIEALTGAETVATSYLFASKPAWFGDRPWPWCDPTNYAQSNTYTNLPAGYRALNGVDPPTGSSPPVGTPVLSVR